MKWKVTRVEQILWKKSQPKKHNNFPFLAFQKFYVELIHGKKTCFYKMTTHCICLFYLNEGKVIGSSRFKPEQVFVVITTLGCLQEAVQRSSASEIGVKSTGSSRHTIK